MKLLREILDLSISYILCGVISIPFLIILHSGLLIPKPVIIFLTFIWAIQILPMIVFLNNYFYTKIYIFRSRKDYDISTKN